MDDPTISDSERRDRLRLYRSENVGPVTYRELLAHCGSAAAALAALPELARRAGRRRITVCPSAAAEAELDTLARMGARLVTLGEPAYPSALAAAEDAPPVLAVRGETEVLTRPCVAIVGARNASTNGRRLAHELAGGLCADAEAGFVVVSGLARGIDAAAHQGALAVGGKTIAVLAGGLDVAYPPEHAGLLDEVCASGAAVSEMPPGLHPQARHFPRRNRVVSGLSLGVVVVEAAARSGSLITARLALEQGREVFAVPGSPLDPRSAGANRLLRDGAVLTESAADIVAVLGPMLARPAAAAPRPIATAEAGTADSLDTLSDARTAIAACLSPEPVTVDEIVRQCQVTAPVVRTVLLEMELAGLVERQPGDRIAAI